MSPIYVPAGGHAPRQRQWPCCRQRVRRSHEHDRSSWNDTRAHALALATDSCARKSRRDDRRSRPTTGAARTTGAGTAKASATSGSSRWPRQPACSPSSATNGGIEVEGQARGDVLDPGQGRRHRRDPGARARDRGRRPRQRHARARSTPKGRAVSESRRLVGQLPRRGPARAQSLGARRATAASASRTWTPESSSRPATAA